jgi:hypothetical protein
MPCLLVVTFLECLECNTGSTVLEILVMLPDIRECVDRRVVYHGS